MTTLSGIDLVRSVVRNNAEIARAMGITRQAVYVMRRITPEQAAALDRAFAPRLRADDILPGVIWDRDANGHITSYRMRLASEAA